MPNIYKNIYHVEISKLKNDFYANFFVLFIFFHSKDREKVLILSKVLQNNSKQ